MKRILEFLIPRFMVEDVALEWRDDGYHIVCSTDDLLDWEVFDGIVTVRCFSWLGLGAFPKQIGEVRPFVNPHSTRVTA